MVQLPPEVEARLLEEAAEDLERMAADRYERSARWYGGGSSTFVRSVDTADKYMKEAKAKRAKAAQYRLMATAAAAAKKKE